MGYERSLLYLCCYLEHYKWFGLSLMSCFGLHQVSLQKQQLYLSLSCSHSEA